MLTQPQIDFFHANGYLIMPGIFAGLELELLQAAAENTVQEGLRRENEASHRYMAGVDGSPIYWRSEELWQREAIFRAATVNPELLQNIGQCIGEAFYPWNDSLVVKRPGNGAPVLWHQDPPYGKPERMTTFAVPNFTTDIYLDRSGPENGCVFAIPGRHREGRVDISNLSQEELFGQSIPLEMEPGDVLFHSLSTPHGSRGNTSSTQRRVLYLHYVAESVFQDGYADEPWTVDKPGWCPKRKALVTRMLADRESLGLGTIRSTENIRFGEGGFMFNGSPSTPPRFWQ